MLQNFPSLLIHTTLPGHTTSAEILFTLCCTATGFTHSAFINRDIGATEGIGQQIILHVIPPSPVPAPHMHAYRTSHTHLLALLSSPTEDQIPNFGKGDRVATGRQGQEGTIH